MSHFQIRISSSELRNDLVLASGEDFRLGDIDLDRFFQISLPKRERDLVRIMMAVYIADRLIRRPRRQHDAPGSREIELQVDVADLEFWRDAHAARLMEDAMRRLSNDFWSFRFQAGHAVPQQLPLLVEAPSVCLYSAGLDSACGLCRRARDDKSPILTVTAAYQSFHGRVREQAKRILERYGVRIRPVLCRTRLANAPRLRQQETSQRLRSALFMALGGAIASAVRADAVEVFENGVGAINLPPQLGMMLGSMATRGCHPGALMAAGRLISHVAGRNIQFRLPMLRDTKAEAVRAIAQDGMKDLARLTMSCGHWPLRVEGPGKQCGTCFPCIGRRQALIVGGIPDAAENYAVDLFGAHQGDLYVGRALLPLKATLMQVNDLRNLCETGSQPNGFADHISETEVCSFGMRIDEVIDLHRRYVREWQPLIGQAKEDGVPWASWIKRVGLAA